MPDMPPAAYRTALRLIDKERNLKKGRSGWSATRRDLVDLVLELTTVDVPHGTIVALGPRYAADAIGLTQRRTGQVLVELAEIDHVLRIVERGRGQRAHAFAMNPDLADWRVAWRVPFEVVTLRVLDAAGLVSWAGKTPVAGSPMPSRQNFLVRSPKPSQLVDAFRLPLAQPTTERIVRLPMPSQQKPNGSARSLSSSSSSENYLTTRERASFGDNLTELTGAIVIRTGAYVAASLERRLAAVCGVVDMDAALDAIERSQNLGPPLLVSLVEQLAAANSSRRPARAPTADELDLKRSVLATFEASDAPAETLEAMRRDLKDAENLAGSATI